MAGLNQDRLADIDRAKGLAILLVVIGHLYRYAPAGNEWYDGLKFHIYAFHMCFFMYISGSVLGYTYKSIRSFAQYWGYVQKRFMRLFPIYLGMGLLVLVGKLVARRFIHVDNVQDDFLVGLYRILVDPMHSCLTQLWYVYVLLGLAVILPVLMEATKRRIWLLLPGAVVLRFVPLPDMFALHMFGQYMLFFVLGCWAGQHREKYVPYLDRFGVWAMLLFAASFVLLHIGIEGVWPGLIIGLWSIPALHVAVRCRPLATSRGLEELGRCALPIYLMHAIVIGVMKGVVLEFTPMDGGVFPLMAPILVISGLCVPVALKRFLLDRVVKFRRVRVRISTEVSTRRK